VYWFHDNEEILLSIVTALYHIAMHRGVHTYPPPQKKKWKGYHSTPVHTISWSIILSDTYRISHGLWCDFYPTNCVFSKAIPEPWRGDRKRTTSWIKIIAHHNKTWEILFITYLPPHICFFLIYSSNGVV
jgi:hypothetical protein